MNLFPHRFRKVTKILKKPENLRTEEEIKIIQECKPIVAVIEDKIQKSIISKERCKEYEDPEEVLDFKCKALAQIIKDAKRMIVYTGAGISTSAQIPDYRGPNGVWTQINKKGQILPSNDLSCAEPTFTHLAIMKLYKCNIVKHVVSQNCDGLHLRSGLPQEALSEIHGNMYIEVCQSCKTQYFRDFDVTEHTSFHRHKTGRKCKKCSEETGDLVDTIVHFGEKGKFEWPQNWKGTQKHCSDPDVILCLGSSLKILRKYQCLWPKKHNGLPKICIVNLQWTPKDSQSFLKINGKCDEVIRRVMSILDIAVDNYSKENDGLLYLYTPLTLEEEETCNRIRLFSESKKELQTQIIPGWFGKGIRIKKK
ncbi:chromatin regulatory protein sir2-like protein [Leptotrombidium deliense]|uniref:protein acetyllysine N-acetyltransferase n=1 Tax=Leptotrombidium deliense TaxID=299467 RepID=A0A443SLZ8_9ACAR|nr:chromatin regulatory protein sir2-like protein [Leptotrombidium deliense]